MEKTIELGNKAIRLSNNVSWAMIYRDQFGHDIIPTLTPMVAAALDITSGFFEGVETKDGKVEVADVLKNLNGEKLIDALAHLSGLEFVDLINITWAMAKVLDDDIPEPKRWIRDFESFPVDVIAPEVAKLAVKGLVSTKNLRRLNDLRKKMGKVQPLNLTPSSSQDLSEDSPFPTFA